MLTFAAGDFVDGLGDADEPGATVVGDTDVLEPVNGVVAVVGGPVGAPPPASPAGANRVLGAESTCGVSGIELG